MRYRFLLMCLLATPAFSADGPGYLLQPEDVLTVTVYNHDELTRDVVVLDTGRFNYPIVGSVMAAGLTPETLADSLATGLKRELLSPKVTVSVKQPAVRRVYASGAVAHPGSYGMKPGWRVSHLITEAGGLEAINGQPARTDLLKASLVRDREVLPVDLSAVFAATNIDADIALQPGDLLQIQRDTNLVHVIGKVKTPGDYELKAHLGVVEAVSLAGGASDDAALSRVHLVHGSKVIPVDLHALLAGVATAENPEVQPGDTVMVPPNEARIAVLGAVQGAGYFDLPDAKAVSVADALAMAKGATKRARLDHVALLRTTEGKQTVTRIDLARFLKLGDVTQNPTMNAGDVVFVPDRGGVESNTAISALATLVSPLAYSLVGKF